MAQLGIHGLVGLYGVPGTSRSAARDAGAFKFGFVLGNILPDADFFLLGITYLFNSKLAVTMHRSFSHSILVAALLTAIIYVFWGSRPGARRLALGLGLGMLVHSVLDMLVWFSRVDFLWPLGLFGVNSVVNLWAWFKPPAIVSNLLGAADYLAFALYFLALRALAVRLETNTGFLGRLGRFTILQWILLVIYTVLSFFLSGPIFEVAHYALFILVMLPITLYVTFKMRATIERA